MDGSHHAAKLVTIGTPHLGSNAADVLPEFLTHIDQRSEAARDLRYHYGSGSFPPSVAVDTAVYLFGGNELKPFPHGGFYNYDFDGDGKQVGFILGLNQDYQTRLPTDVEYLWLRGKHTLLPPPIPEGDGAVRFDRQALPDIGITKAFSKDVVHTKKIPGSEYELGQHAEIVEALDEPPNFQNAWTLVVPGVYSGFATPQLSGQTLDTDVYRLHLNEPGRLEVLITGLTPTQLNISAIVKLYAIGDTVDAIARADNGPQQTQMSFAKDGLVAGDYFLHFVTQPTNETWKHPHRIELKFVGEPTQITLRSNTSSIPADGVSSIKLFAEIRDSQGIIVPGTTNPISFAITSGSSSGTLIGANPATPSNGVASILFQSTTTAGSAVIEASSPGLTSANITVNVFGTFTVVGGIIAKDSTWRASQSPFIVTSDVTVHNGATLTIEPGVTVLFHSGTQLRISSSNSSGSLVANGAQASSILFTSFSGDKNDWKGILFDDRSDQGMTSSMTWCKIEKAGQTNSRGANANIYCYNTNTPIISNCTFGQPLTFEHAGNALHLHASSPSISQSTFYNSGVLEVVRLTGGSDPSFTGCTFTGSGSSYWLFSDDGDCNPTISSCSFDGSVINAVRIGTHFQMNGNIFQGATSPEIEIWGGDLTNSRTWRKQTGGSVYAIVGRNYRVIASSTLTIEPGVTVKFSSGTGLIIGGDGGFGGSLAGSLLANGTPSDSILFTSLTGNSGNWRGILFDNDSDKILTSSLSYCVIEKAGETNSQGSTAAVYCRVTTTPVINQTIIRNNGGYGLYLNASSPRITNSVLSANTLSAIYITGNSNPIIANAYGASNNIFGSSGLYDLENTSPNDINARYNYWGTLDPNQIAARILDKADNSNYGQVFYEPWTDSTHTAVLPDKVPPSNPAWVVAWSDTSRSVPIFERVPYSYINPHFAWAAATDLSGIAGYSVIFTSDSLAVPPLIVTQQDSSFTVTQPLRPNSTYFLRLRARDNAGNWSNAVTLFVYRYETDVNHDPSMPVALLPLYGEELRPDGLLLWSESKDPDFGDVVTYILQIDNDSTFASPEVNHSGIGGATASMAQSIHSQAAENNTQIANAVAVRLDTLRGYANLVDNVIYFWRVSAQDNRNGQSPFTSGRDRFFFNRVNSAPGRVTEGFSPREGTEVRLSRPEISWHPAIDPDKSDHSSTLRYNLQLKDAPDFSTTARFSYQTKIGLATFEVPDSLDENGHWYWRVQTVDDEGLTSDWSVVQDFWVNAVDEPPAPFALLEPANGSSFSGDTLHFRWENTFDPDPRDRFVFIFELARDSLFSQLIMHATDLTVNSFAVPNTNLPVGRIYWRIRAVDSDKKVQWGSNSNERPWHVNVGTTAVSDTSRETGVPTKFYLGQNYPNPFNPETTIEFALPQRSYVTIRIFNLAGSEVRSLLNKAMEPGYHKVSWDGKDASGRFVPTGVYLYKMQAGEFVAIRKCVVIH